MFFNLVLLFTVVPAVELALLIKVGTYIGAMNTIMLIIFTGVLGASLARFQGFHVLQSIQTNMEQGRMPTEPMLDGAMIFIGGIVLLTPGFITDAMGFLLLIPWTRTLLKMYLRNRMQKDFFQSRHTEIHTFPEEEEWNRFEDADFRE